MLDQSPYLSIHSVPLLFDRSYVSPLSAATRQLLEDFYAPHTLRLATLLNDSNTVHGGMRNW